MAIPILERLRRGLSRTRQALAERWNALFAPFRKVDEGFLSDLEETLLLADVGPPTAAAVTEELRRAWKLRKVASVEDARAFLRAEFERMLHVDHPGIRFAPSGPTAVLVTGVNGSGKTTSVAKLAHMYAREGRKVLLAAADTFRAAAIEQLSIWAQRIGADIVRHRHGADPGAVVWDAAEAAVARGADLLLVDTAGRLHTKEHLMRELGKVRTVLSRKISGAPHESLLVLDATTGQNAIAQARQFAEAAGLTGIFLAKLDGTAKGGVALAIRREMGLPVRFVGLGETPADVALFSARDFVEALLAPPEPN